MFFDLSFENHGSSEKERERERKKERGCSWSGYEECFKSWKAQKPLHGSKAQQIVTTGRTSDSLPLEGGKSGRGPPSCVQSCVGRAIYAADRPSFPLSADGPRNFCQIFGDVPMENKRERERERRVVENAEGRARRIERGEMEREG